MKPIVIIESPYAGDIKRNVRYACAAMLDCLERGEAPLASHLLYTQVWDDANPEQRKLGMEAGFVFYEIAQTCVVYKDLGISPGMLAGISAAQAECVDIEYRSLPNWES